MTRHLLSIRGRLTATCARLTTLHQDHLMVSRPVSEKNCLKTLQKQVDELISGPPEEKQHFKKMVADRLKELTEGVTSGTPDRARYSVSSKGLLEAAKFVKDFSAEIGSTLKNLGTSFWPDFKLTDIFR